MGIAMDRTQEFRESLATAKRMAGELEEMQADPRPKKGKADLSLKPRKPRPKSGFAAGVRSLLKTVSKMKQLLVKTRRDYINLYPLLSHASRMSDSERDQIDRDVDGFMKSCGQVIQSLRAEANLADLSPQVKEHQMAVISLIEKYLRMVCGIYSQQKAIRVKRAFEKQKMSRLELASGFRRAVVPKVGDRTPVDPDLSSPGNRNHRRGVDLAPFSENFVEEQSGTKFEVDSNELAVDELQLFDEENVQLFEEMNALTDEVKQIGGKVVEIAHLQEIFTENVLQQEQDLNRLSETVVGSTETIRGGNEQLREAMKKNAGFRVWILFFIITLAFTVLFLDWYNP